MTREEKVKNLLTELIDMVDNGSQKDLDRADEIGASIIKLFEQESVLDKIRAEILEEKECAYADFERYKVDYLGQDWEDVLDSLPHDDFRYGMERAIEIIDKNKAESER